MLFTARNFCFAAKQNILIQKKSDQKEEVQNNEELFNFVSTVKDDFEPIQSDDRFRKR